MNDFRLQAKGTWCYEQFKDVDDMNDWMSHELKALDAMNNSRLRLMWTILGHEIKVLDAMKSSGLWMT